MIVVSRAPLGRVLSIMKAAQASTIRLVTINGHLGRGRDRRQALPHQRRNVTSILRRRVGTAPTLLQQEKSALLFLSAGYRTVQIGPCFTQSTILGETNDTIQGDLVLLRMDDESELSVQAQ